MRISVRAALGSLLLAVQLVMIVVARFHPMRYYCWAPYDSQNEYEIAAVVDGEPLNGSSIEARYGWRTPDVNPRMILQVIDTIAYVERVYHPDQDARVTVTYRTNGGPERRWHWPTR